MERGILLSMSRRLKSRTTVFHNFSKNRTDQPRLIGKYVAGWELLKSKLVAILARIIPCETFLERGILVSMSQRLKSRTTVFRNFSKNDYLAKFLDKMDEKGAVQTTLECSRNPPFSLIA